MPADLPAVDVCAASWKLRCAIAVGMALSFAMVAHHWSASVSTEAVATGFQHRENRFAKQQATTTSSSAMGFVLLGALGATLAIGAPPERRRWLHPLGSLFFAYVVWCLASFTWSGDLILTARKLAILLLLIAAAWGVAIRCSLQDVLWSVILCLTGMILLGFVAEVSQGTFRPWRSDYRFSGTLDPNGMGLEAATLALAAWLVPFDRRNRPYVRAALVTLGVAVVIVTKSRTSLAALTAAGMVVLLLQARGQQRWLVASGTIVLACILGLIVNFVSVATVEQSASVATMGRAENISSLTGRWPLWQAVLKEADDAPLVGHGFGAFWTSQRIYRYSDAFLWHIPHAHNTYIDLVLATGMIGLSLYLLWIVALAIAAWVRYDRVGNPVDLFVVSFAASCLVHGGAESKIPGAGITTLLLYACGAALALRPAVAPTSLQDEKEVAPPAPLVWLPARRWSA